MTENGFWFVESSNLARTLTALYILVYIFLFLRKTDTEEATTTKHSNLNKYHMKFYKPFENI